MSEKYHDFVGDLLIATGTGGMKLVIRLRKYVDLHLIDGALTWPGCRGKGQRRLTTYLRGLRKRVGWVG